MKRSTRASRRKPPRSKVAPKARKTATRKRRGGGGKKMKAYASFDLYFADQTPRNRRLIRALRQFVQRVAPQLEESVKWGNGCWLQAGVPVAYVYSAPTYVQFGFLRGTSLSDPRGLLQGRGRYVRHIKVTKPADIDERAFAALLRQAIR